MIRNIENNKFLNANNYKGLNGDFIEGIGVAFDSKEDATNYNMTSGQRMTFVTNLETINHNGNTLYIHATTNVWD